MALAPKISFSRKRQCIKYTFLFGMFHHLNVTHMLHNPHCQYTTESYTFATENFQRLALLVSILDFLPLLLKQLISLNSQLYLEFQYTCASVLVCQQHYVENTWTMPNMHSQVKALACRTCLCQNSKYWLKFNYSSIIVHAHNSIHVFIHLQILQWNF